MKKLIVFVILCCLSISALAQGEANRTAGLKRNDGFIPFYWDARKGTLLFELSPQRMNDEFIYFTGLSSGIASTPMVAHRTSTGGSQLFKLVPSRPNAVVIAENTAFSAEPRRTALEHAADPN